MLQDAYIHVLPLIAEVVQRTEKRNDDVLLLET